MEMRTNPYQKTNRLPYFDYSSAGYYFVTIVSHKRKNIFGDIIDGEIDLNPLGTIVEETWQEIPMHFSYIDVDSHIVMPNHFHGIVIINEVGAQHAEPLRHIKTQPLGVIVRLFKSAITKRVQDPGLYLQKNLAAKLLRAYHPG